MQSTTHTVIEAGTNAATAPMMDRQIVADFILFSVFVAMNENEVEAKIFLCRTLPHTYLCTYNAPSHLTTSPPAGGQRGTSV